MWKLFIDDDCETVRAPEITVENAEWRAIMGLPLVIPDTDGMGPWVKAKSADEAIAAMIERGFPNYISFDHDLGDGKDAMHVVNWMIEVDMDTGAIPKDFRFEAHSANPVGRRNITEKMGSYIEYRSRMENTKGFAP